MKVYVPPIKTQGIKTKLVPHIQTILPNDITGKWVEPFMGSGVVGFNLAGSEAEFSDSNPHIINFYQAIKNRSIDPLIVREYLEYEGSILLEKGEDHYYDIRERFNTDAAPLDFLFLNRAGFNGMIRFNRKGGFNIPFCRKPNRFSKAYVTKIVNQVAHITQMVNGNDYSFTRQGFEDSILSAKDGDIIYCDPPYIGRHADYFNGWNEENENKLFELLSNSPAKFILSTWHHNKYRENEYIESLWSEFNVLTREHFYHVGGSESNRNSMTEALITNF